MDNTINDVTTILAEKFSLLRKEIKERQDEMLQVGAALKAIAPELYEQILKSNPIDDGKMSRRNVIKLNEKEREEYSKIKKAGDRIVYVISLFDRAVKSKMIERLIMDIEGATMGKQTASSLPQKLKYLVNEGKLVLAKYSGSNKYGFYILPKWKSSSKKIGIIPAHAPLAHDFENLSKENRNPSLIEWVDSEE